MNGRGLSRGWVLLGMIFWGATTPNNEDILSRWEATEAHVKSLSFHFTQSVNIKVTGETTQIEGKVEFARPGKFRVIHQSPQDQEVVSDGSTFWIYNKARGQVVRDRLDNWWKSSGMPTELVPMLSNVSDLKATYTVTVEKGTNGEPDSLRLTPKKASALAYQLRLWIDEKTGLPQKTEMTSTSVTTTLTIQNVAINPEFSTENFVFKAPSGIGVMDLSNPEDRK